MNRSEYNKSVSLYSDSIYRFVLKNLRDIEKSKDVVQESYMKLWDKRDNVNFEKVKSYLFTTAYHCMIDGIRRDKKQSPIHESDLNSYSQTNSYSDHKEIIDQAVAHLSDIQRSVILLRDYEGYSYNEIAEILSLTDAQVKVYIFRARKFLKSYLISLENII